MGSTKPARSSHLRGGANFLAWILLGLPRGLATRTNEANGAEPADGALTTRWGTWWGRHTRLLHALVALALCWSAAYLAWRIGWSRQSSNPVLWVALLLAEAYGCWNLVMLSWITWDVRSPRRPAPTPGRAVDVYICTYDEPVAVLEATLAGCALLDYPHTTHVLDDGRRPEIAALAALWDARYLTRPNNTHAKAGNINHALPRTDGRARARARRRPRPPARRARHARRLLRRPRGRARAEPARLLQPRLRPALRPRTPRAVGLLRCDLPRQGPPQRLLLVRLRRADPARRAARGRWRRNRDDRRGLPHDDQAPSRRLAHPLRQARRRAGTRAPRPRRLSAATRSLGARQPRGVHHAGEPVPRPWPDLQATAQLSREPDRLSRGAGSPA